MAVVAVGAIVLATDHRAERLVQAGANGLLSQTSAAGLRLQNVRLAGASPQSSADILHAARLQKGAPLLAPDPLYLRRPDAREPGPPKRVTPS